ncbi:LysR family transcriptional regulator [Lactobacillus taiwanensis]|uniref:LysR family transcriptional regulator n=1 Tax=Lactobacillus taiwanensis TaxID=508451 RepID=UPI000BD659D9|nr:LysR family transcriptional regulator [Lactobacillus taiwanensis]OYR98535.1 LysR family transcriptional regulator [Lactobacillus taiwanensis]OYS04859.1 LysR family transcriptional regulator [Lactobacillus taiwanensis]
MEINKLRTFVDLAKTLSFSETAENLYISQSTISKQIKGLEKELGQKLFERNNKNVTLSDYGKLILPNAKKIVLLSDWISKETSEFKNNSGQIRLGIIPTFANYDIFKQTMNYQKLRPDINLALQEIETNQLVNTLKQKQVDVAFIRTLMPEKLDFEKIIIAQESFTVCLNREHTLANRRKIELADLKDENFIMLAKNSLLYEPVINLCQKAGFEPKISFVSDRMSSIFQMVKSNQGVAILMHPQTKNSELSFVSLEPTSTSTLLFIRNKENHSKIENDFWNYLKQFEMPNRNN